MRMLMDQFNIYSSLKCLCNLNFISGVKTSFCWVHFTPSPNWEFDRMCCVCTEFGLQWNLFILTLSLDILLTNASHLVPRFFFCSSSSHWGWYKLGYIICSKLIQIRQKIQKKTWLFIIKKLNSKKKIMNFYVQGEIH